MMEGLTHMGQEEYIWAMRTGAFRDDLTPKGFRRLRPTSQFILPSETTSFEINRTNDEKQTKVMASLVPDEVIYNVNDYTHRQYDSCFLFGDVSGFTELCEKYGKTGVSGPSRMSQVLNKYLGSMVQEVLSHNGDILKFSGDAFLAVFKTSDLESMRDTVHETMNCALVIQKNYGSYLTDVGVVIRVKLAISAGLVTFALIGTETSSHYVVVGQPIWDVKAAEHICSAGDIIVAPAAWKYVNVNEYVFQEMADNIHIKLLGVGTNWRSVQRNVRQQKNDLSKETVISDASSSDSDILSDTNEGVMDEFSLRPAVNRACRHAIKKDLRKFIIAPVMKSIDMDEPFEYLTEMRQVTILVINVSFKLQDDETVILANQSYKAVCRGLKHALECQMALRCARECLTTIQKLSGVLSTSIGVTTGKTYCGVFGHSLRREYTVIGLVVNKAARLMVAYKNKVTCDKDTFLNSKLESRHFFLQIYKPLKGITSPGPVYEFVETDIDHDIVQKINARPLLGRIEKLKLYHQLLETWGLDTDDKRQYKMLLIKGDARQGKTRLLDEFVYTTSEEISVVKIGLVKKDQKIPYQAIKLIFNLPLQMTSESSVSEKEEKLLKTLHKVKVHGLICALNDVFGVNFTNSKLYMSMNKDDKMLTLRKLIKLLAHICFVTPWVLAIDDCEFIDNSSWMVFTTLFEVKNIFVVATIGRERLNRSPECEKTIGDRRIKTGTVKPIPRVYLGALACQILDVYAISPELENIIQTRSNGNPGWVESYLICSIQEKTLNIVKVTLNQIQELGLVCPPLYMMDRISKNDKHRWQSVMEERKSAEDTTKWEKYIDICRDSFLNVTIRGQMEGIATGGKVPICVVSETFSVSDNDVELSIDGMILKTFDSLNYYEQLLVKCSATLGYEFFRQMLLYVMSAVEPRKVALAVKKLFEVRVLTCAKGDFIQEGAGYFKERLVNPMEENEPTCQCKGVSIYEECIDLPKYASCGYLQFRSPLFRDITYNLLTDHQKKEFHHRAINYLERETQKCKACGGGFFERILGIKHDEEFLLIRSKQKKIGGDFKWEAHRITDNASSSDSEHSFHSISTTSFQTLSRRSVAFSRIGKVSSPRTSQRYSTVSSPAFFENYMIKKLTDTVSLTRAFSVEDFSECQCTLILNSTYAQLIEHCNGAGKLHQLIEAMLEYAHTSIILSNMPLAMRTLNEALDVIMRIAFEYREGENLWKYALIRAKIHILIGYSLLEMGHLDQAHEHLHTALKQYGIKFPTGFRRQMKTSVYKLKQIFGFYVFPNTLLKNLDHWETVYSNNLSECLSLLCILYMTRNEWRKAEMAATWSLTKSLESFSDFRVICTACTNMINVAQHFARWRMCMALEVYALKICHYKKYNLQAEDLRCVARLYGVIFTSRICQTQIDKAVHIGYIVLQLCASIHAAKIFLPLLPYLLHVLLMKKNFNLASAVLRELEDLAHYYVDTSGKLWYYAQCLIIHLETGFTVLHYNSCRDFYTLEDIAWITMKDPDAGKRFFVVMWLWCLRNELWEEASIWSEKVDNFMIITETDSLPNKFSALYVLEGLLLYLAYKIDKYNMLAVGDTRNHINKLIKSIEKVAKSDEILFPRLYHLKAYYRYISYNDAKVTDLLEKATKYAKKQTNLLEAAWIEHSTKAWNKELQPAAVDFWKEHSDIDNTVNFEAIETHERIGFFTLPTPWYM